MLLLPAAPVPGPGRAPPASRSPGATHGERTALGTGGPAQTASSPHRPGQRGCPTPGIPRSPGEKPLHHPQLTHQTSQLRCRPPPRGSGSPVHGGVIHTVPDTMEIRGRPPASPPPSRSLPRLGSAQPRRPLIPPPSPGSPPPSPAAAAAEPGRAPRPPPAPAPPPLPRLTLSQPRRRRAGLSSPPHPPARTAGAGKRVPLPPPPCGAGCSGKPHRAESRPKSGAVSPRKAAQHQHSWTRFELMTPSPVPS